jgi:integrase/recombinase XerD
LSTGSICIKGKGRKERFAFLIEPYEINEMKLYLSICSTFDMAHDRLLVNSRFEPLTEEGVRNILKRLAQKAGVDKKITPHMFRHTAATRLLENGADLRVVQEFLGHSSIRMTERYTHVSKRFLRHTLAKYHPLKMMAA